MFGLAIVFAAGIAVGWFLTSILFFFIFHKSLVDEQKEKTEELKKCNTALNNLLSTSLDMENRLAHIEGRIAVPDAQARTEATDQTRAE